MKYSRNSCLPWLIQFDFEIRRILNVTACIAWLTLQFVSVFFRRPRLGMPSYMEELFTTSGWYLRANPSQNDRFHRFRRLICICICIRLICRCGQNWQSTGQKSTDSGNDFLFVILYYVGKYYNNSFSDWELFSSPSSFPIFEISPEGQTWRSLTLLSTTQSAKQLPVSMFVIFRHISIWDGNHLLAAGVFYIVTQRKNVWWKPACA